MPAPIRTYSLLPSPAASDPTLVEPLSLPPRHALAPGFLGRCAALFLLTLSAQAQSPLLPTLFFEDGASWRALGAGVQARFSAAGAQLSAGSQSLAIHFDAASPGARLTPCGDPNGPIHLLLGNDPALWRRDIPSHSCLLSNGLYPGIDLRWSASSGRIKSDYLLAPHSDPGLIRLRYSAPPRLAPDGALLLGDWREEPPTASQNGHPVEVRYHLHPNGSVGFTLGPYDPFLPLTIDPVVTFSTLLGGSGISSATAVATDAAGFLYLAGYTDAADLPQVAPAQIRAGGVDAFVAKIHPSTGRLIYATYLGGTADDRAFALAVDSLGSAYVAGWTTSSNFPTVNAVRSTLSGSKDAFLVKLSPAGSSATFATYYGGSGADTANALALSSSYVYLGGETNSTDLPSATGFQSTSRGGMDGFLARFSLTGTLTVSSYLGGNGDDTVRALALDPTGHLYAAGMTASTNLTTSTGALQTTLKGQVDAMIYKLDAALLTLLGGTYLGGNLGDLSSQESIFALAADSLENVYAAGTTPSGDFPTPNAWAGTLAGQQDAFAVRLNPNFSSLAWGTFLGGAARDVATALALDSSNGLWLAGSTSSSAFPTANPLQATYAGATDGFFSRLDTATGTPSFSTFFGGSGADGANALALAPSGSLFLAGQSSSLDFRQRNPSQAPAGSLPRMFATRLAIGTLPTTGTYTSGAAWTFSATHSGGASQIAQLELLITPGLSYAAACQLRYSRSTGLLALASDTGLVFSSVHPGVAETATNSQCTLTGTGSSVSSSGNTLTITAAVTFKSPFAGVKQVLLNAANNTLEETGFELKGTYTVSGVSNVAPTLSAPSPASGSGSSQVFTFTFNDANGAADIAAARMLFNTSASEAAACALRYDRASGNLQLADDAGATFSAAAPGSQTTLSNSRCQLRLATSSVIVAGTVLQIRLDLSFLALFAGAKNIYLYAADSAGLSVGFTSQGTWTATAPNVPSTPVPASVTPSAGSGSTQVFTFTFTDLNGAADISTFRLLVNSTQTATGGCYLWWDRTAGVVWLANDAGSSWSAAARLGTTETASNSQCTFSAATSNASSSGNTLTVNAALSFKAPLNGAQKIWANVTDSGGLTSTSPQLGTYTVVISGGYPLGPVSVSPSSGSGSSQLFTIQFADPKGATDLTWVRVLMNATQVAPNGCFLSVDTVNRLAYLTADDGGAWTPVHLGLAETTSNSQCSIRAATSSLSLSGSLATLVLDLSFNYTFNGAKSLWANATDASGATSAAPRIGAYTVNAPISNQPPAPVSVSPANGSGGRQVFTLTYTDPNGGADILDARMLMNTTQQAASGCYVVVNPGPNTIQLADDFGANWATAHLGTSETAQNSQCTVYGATTTWSVNGTNVTLALDIGFKTGFLGAHSIWANATDAAGLASASPLIGSYNVTAGSVNQIPVPVSVSPSSGSGNRQKFTFTLSDADGGSDITFARFLIHSTQQAGGGCYIMINRNAGLLFLADDSGGNWSLTHLGQAETATNSQCTIYAATSTLAGSGNNVTVGVDVSFKAAFAGAKSVWANVTDASGTTSPSPLLGSWTATP